MGRTCVFLTSLLLCLSLAGLATAADLSRISLSLYGLSYHLDRRDVDGYKFNEINPGIGLQYAFHQKHKSRYSLESGILLDSYRRRASYFVLSYEYSLLHQVGIGLMFGLYDSRAVSESGAVVAAAPMLSFHAGRLSLRLFHLPEFPGINPYPSFAASLCIALGSGRPATGDFRAGN